LRRYIETNTWLHAITAGQGKSSTLGQMRLNICLKKAGKRNWLTENGSIFVLSAITRSNVVYWETNVQVIV